MELKKKFASVALIAMSALSFSSVPVFTSVWASGRVWSYGCNNNSWNWGAFSNYYHNQRNHWSSVVRDREVKGSYGYTGPWYTSQSFINTNFGEYAYFNYGFLK